MPRKKATKPTEVANKKVEFQGFLSLSLSPQEKKHVKDNILDFASITQMVQDVVFTGYKVSFSFSKREDCWTVTAYGNQIGHLDAGYAMSIRHADFDTACSALHFCLEEAGKAGSLTEWLGTGGETDW